MEKKGRGRERNIMESKGRELEGGRYRMEREPNGKEKERTEKKGTGRKGNGKEGNQVKQK